MVTRLQVGQVIHSSRDRREVFLLEVRDQLQQISASVEAIAIEVERISEGQRFTTKLLTDKTRELSPVTPSGD